MKYRLNYQIQFMDCDEQGKLKLSALIKLMMHISNLQLSQIGLGTKDFLTKNLGWVVTQYQFDFKRWPRGSEQVVLTTEAKGFNRFFCYRDFGVETSAGEELITVHSQWVILDLAQRKMVTPTADLLSPLVQEANVRGKRIKRLRPLAEYDKKGSYLVRYDDLDTNHHVDNANYFVWMTDPLGRDFLNQYEPASLLIQFDQEVQYGQMVDSLLTVSEQSSQHEIMSAGQKNALALIKWRKVDKETNF
ncbi:MAG: thioesterase [Lactobacillus sp.]|jgi:medium-chain acyl-[acyl-carrier-protein] hydrolase|nr:thioesterase [Lactobacillus sp.]MCH3905954.1 thioesterase [Lactobacillus sp.]MCH3990472.1 thioesterase [Lactobacillus sp.]MCH4068813.1 thioesterase [Lactobacillus sp.]MCI1304438.1 thioesterase [Lactobacillus sp.]